MAEWLARLSINRAYRGVKGSILKMVYLFLLFFLYMVVCFISRMFLLFPNNIKLLASCLSYTTLFTLFATLCEILKLSMEDDLCLFTPKVSGRPKKPKVFPDNVISTVRKRLFYCLFL